MPRPKDLPAALDPQAPHFAAAWAAAVYALCTLVLAYPALGGAFLVSPRSDQYIAGYAFRDFAAMSLRAGHGFPQWNPYLFGGLPYIAAMHGDIFYPTFLLRMIMPTDQAMTWGFVIHLFLAGIFTYGFLRAWGLSFAASLFGGLAYMLGGNVAGLASPGHDGKLFVSALFPLGLWMLVRGIRDGRPWAWGMFALTVGLAVISPHPQLLQYMLLASGSFALFLAFAHLENGPPLDRSVAARRLGLALAAVAVGLLIGAVQYLPVREYVAWSPRAGGRGYEYATSYSLPFEEIINTYLPQFSGILDHYWGRNGIHLHSEYLGVVVLMLASASIGFDGRRAFRRFWLGTCAIALLWALGSNTPFYRLVYALVPGSKFFRAPSTMLYLVSFTVAVLSALGLERALSQRLSRGLLGGWIIGAAAIAIVASAGGFAPIAEAVAAALSSAAYPPEVAARVTEGFAANATALTLGAWRCVLVVALGVGVLLLSARQGLPRRVVAWSLTVLSALDLLSVARIYWIFSPPAARIFATDPAVDFLRKAEPGRVWAIQLAAGAVARDPYLDYDGLMTHAIRVVQGYHGNELGRYQQLTRNYDTPLLANPQFWRHENVRYLYTNADDSTVARLFAPLRLDAPVRRLVGPVRNSVGTSVYVYRLPGDNPVAWVTPIVVKAPDDIALATVLDRRFDPTRAAVADTSDTVLDARQVTSLPPSVNPFVVPITYQPGHITLQLAVPAPPGAGLVVSENFFPGWRATVDGKPVGVGRVDYNLIGVGLPAGARTVDLTFSDAAYGRGKVVTLLALVAVVMSVIIGVARGRHPAPEPSAA